MNFLCQKINNKITFDFVFAMSQAEDYYSWFDKDGIKIRWTQNPTFKSIEAPQEYIPVGSVEFVSDYMRKFYPEAAKKSIDETEDYLAGLYAELDKLEHNG